MSWICGREWGLRNMNSFTGSATNIPYDLGQGTNYYILVLCFPNLDLQWSILEAAMAHWDPRWSMSYTVNKALYHIRGRREYVFVVRHILKMLLNMKQNKHCQNTSDEWFKRILKRERPHWKKPPPASQNKAIPEQLCKTTKNKECAFRDRNHNI